MGSLMSKVIGGGGKSSQPALPAPIPYPQLAAPDPIAPPSAMDEAGAALTQEQNAEAARIAEIARRARGISETIQTGYRGILSERDTPNIPRRKTLLGE